RDFGAEWLGMPWFGYSSDFGVFLGGGVRHNDYGFRKVPYASQFTLKAGYATKAAAFRTDLVADFRNQNSRAHTLFLAHASQLDILHFHGFGNDVPAL